MTLLRRGGQFEHLQPATRRFLSVAPTALDLIFLAVPMAITDLAINSSRDFFDHPDSPRIS